MNSTNGSPSEPSAKTYNLLYASAGMVIKNTFLSMTDNAPVALRKILIESCKLQTVLGCPQ